MIGMTRAVFTLLGVASAVVLVWLASQVGDDSTADYWALYGLVAAAGLTMALSQLLGGWTKWGWPRVSGTVLLLGFIPALLVAGWVLGAGQPTENWLQQHVTDWSDDLGIDGVVRDLLDLAGPLAFLAGLTFGFTFDTSGPRPARVAETRRAAPTEPVREREPARQLEPVETRHVDEDEGPTEVRSDDREPVGAGPSEQESTRETR
jgi:hypothetical protein